VDPADVQLVRRLSAAYPEIPGGQWLGQAPELASRLLEWGDAEAASPETETEEPASASPDAAPPTRAACPRVRDLFSDVMVLPAPEDGPGRDPASASLAPPIDRATRLGVLARGETASLVALAALVLGRRREAVLAEVTAAEVAVRILHPRTGRPCAVSEVPLVEAEAVVDADVKGQPALAIGWGVSLGSIERRAIALALLDGALQADDGTASAFAVDDQTVLAAVDGSATNGFVEHLRLPHHASFASYLDQARPGTAAS
jgi:alpha-D-ribose 1-methylphosphonate 5-triphosphate synthase subunit PhnI